LTVPAWVKFLRARGRLLRTSSSSKSAGGRAQVRDARKSARPRPQLRNPASRPGRLRKAARTAVWPLACIDGRPWRDGRASARPGSGRRQACRAELFRSLA